jgi:hypothetical protein
MKTLKKILSGTFFITLLVGLISMPTQQAYSAESNVSVFLSKNCPTTPDCPEPSENDPHFILSGDYNQGDIISLDIRLKNPSKQSIVSAQTWLKYDTNHLEGLNINTNSVFDLVAPGEKEFDTENGRAKIGVASTSGGSQSDQILVATAEFKVKTNSKLSTSISFYDYRLNELGHTNANIIEGGFPVNVLSEPKKELKIPLNGNTSPTGGQTTQPVNNQPTQPNIILGRPSGLQVDTGNGYAQLAWEADLNNQLAGYNIYYSMTSGRYLHRKTIGPVDEFFITGLLNNQKYYFAITAVDIFNNESDYSNEVAIVINQPSTSTSPFYKPMNELDQFLDPEKTIDTGPKTDIAIIIALISGIIGFLIKYSNTQANRVYIPSKQN